MRLSLLVIALLTGIFASAQKKVIDASAYNDWKRVGDVLISPDGKFTTYTIKPHRGDGFLYVVDNESGRTDSFPRGIEPQFAANSSFLVFKITPGFDTLRTVELSKVNKEKWPKDSLGIWYTTSYKLEKIAKVKDFKLAIDSDILAYLSQGNEFPEGYLTKKEKRKEKKELKKNGPVKSDGKLLTIWKPAEEKSKAIHYKNVTTYEFSRNGAFLAFVQQQKYKKDSLRLNVITTNDRSVWKSPKRYTAYNQLSFGETSSKLTGLFSTDTSDQKRWNAFYFDAASNQWNTIIDTAMRFERERVVAGSFKPRFSQDETKLFFGVWDIQKIPAKDTLLETEKAKLDLWHWKDERIQPQQLAELKADEVSSNLHVYLVSEQRFVQLERDSLDIRLPRKGPMDYLLASSDYSYRSQNWRSPMPVNYYRIPTSGGQPELLKEGIFFEATLSPSGRYFVFYNELKKQLFSKDLTSGTETCLTCKVKTNWYNDLNGMPEILGPQGIIGWTENENGVLIQSENNIWQYDLTSDNIDIIFERIQRSAADTNYKYSLGLWSADSVYLQPSNCYLVRMDRKTKAETIFELTGSFSNAGFKQLASSDHHYIGLKKARYADAKVFQRHSAVEFPDVHLIANGKEESKKISSANPQQKDFNWTTVELISWKSYEGIPLEGLVYKPENYDPNKEYPLLVYFYEMYTDELHNHYAPKPTASIIFPTEYASAGYIVLIPDIRYKPGHPANSAYDCIMSGTDAVMKKYPNIDAKRLGLQGQSWGGYQTAQLVTMTDRYAAAMAGAPVSNMFSAYGGIRWGSGYSRQFQYEHTQSRIGKTIWEAPQLYMENSPLFHLPKVKTPLLIMANDQDGAVPWYQGIELYMGLRRLQKPVWMLNYNGDDHNLMKNANRIDLSIRMRQFFDYYLLDKPMPLWLKEGIPAVEKGKDYKLELSE